MTNPEKKKSANGEGKGGKEEARKATKKEEAFVIAETVDEHLAKRRKLLEKEKELTRLRDEVTELRRSLPWVRVAEEYEFDGADGKQRSLKDLFGGKTQLIVQHVMFGPDWKNACKACSFLADHVPGAIPHLAAKDVAVVAIGRAPIETMLAFRDRMGWNGIDFYSSGKNNFNFDYKVSFKEEEFKKNGNKLHYNYTQLPFFMKEFPGISVFALKDDQVYHTYSVYARGLDPFITTYQYLDLVPKGRDEGEGEYKMSWVKLHDEY